ncbi:branched-chain amino acid ABC transporter ATP-binding protein/permease [Gulosibacter molinativorax]|uniref:Branched-chain amino acid ABC transporter permease n=1 Tax=Gulosibacter molinativorax TaxID=256821 RepID=A0ABT7C7H5_9MICO|nr:ATP-binding cassette domain-containing protein [Gulosibacter molinativorax]MDJ1371010.1 branched-chain amino acid ABC transporter permease [Gulosibacter molinativorax]QUY62804.1 Branched chain amino acid ABC transporter, permease/ATP-binding protein [Gulosibacter molinativorax]
MRLARNVFPSRVWTPFVFGLVAIAVGWLVSILLPQTIVFLAISAVIATLTLLGLGIVTGTAGMIVLSQLTFAAVGAWIMSFFTMHEVPGGFYLYLVVAAVAAGVVGLLIGLPALRLRGVNLAVVTLGFAAAADMTLGKTQFPGAGQRVPRPEPFMDDRAFLFFTIIVLVVVAVIVFFLQNSRLGSSWRSVAFSERGTAAAGSNVRTAKLSAFAVSAAIAGISGALIAGQVGAPYASSFTTIQSLALYVLSIVAGTHLVEMALFGGILWVLIPELLKRWGIPQDWGFVVFGVLGIQALTTNSNLGQDIRNAIARRRRKTEEAKLVPFTDEQLAELGPVGVSESDKSVLEVEDVSVTFGSIKALQNVNLKVSEGEIVGLIGPNGAGKSTLVDTVSGFLPSHEGTVRLSGENINKLAPNQRATAGLRRTFQQDRVPPTLSVGDYIEFVAQGASTRDEIREALEFFGCPSPRTRIRNVDVGTRRIIEVTAHLLAKPKLLVLDEPAAGLSHEEHIAFGQRLQRVPERFGTAILIIEHDLDLVRTVCQRVTVLDFGELLAEGGVAEVLDNPEVAKAYMGETELL